MSDVFKWANPPTRRPPTTLSLTISRLKERPGKWAIIAHEGQGLGILPWWGALNVNEEFEVKIVPDNPNEKPFAFGPRTIYAKYVGP